MTDDMDLGRLSVRARNVLQHLCGGSVTLDKLTGLTRRALLAEPNCGPKIAREIAEWLADMEAASGTELTSTRDSLHVRFEG